MAVKSSDQITIVDLTDGYSIMLSLDAISLNGDVSTLGTAQSVTVNVTAYKGGAKVVPTVGTPTCPTNVSASVGSASDSVVPVTISFAAALATAGKVTIPVTVDDVTINKEFAFGISFKGATGATGETGPKGDTGADGEDAILLKITTSAGDIFKNSSSSTTLTAHVYVGGAEVTGATLTALGTAKWYKDGSYMSGKDGVSLTVNASDINSKSTYEARLEALGEIIARDSITITKMRDITSITWFYKLQASTALVPDKPTTFNPSGWTTTEPTYTEGSTNSLYVCQRTLYSDDTFEYSDVSLSTSYEAAKTAYNKAQAAMTSANGKNKIFHQSSAPLASVGLQVGDTWFDTSNGYKINTWDGSQWVAEPLDTDALAVGAVKAQTIDAGAVTADKIRAEAVTADKIKAGGITTEKLAVGDFNNYATVNENYEASMCNISGRKTVISSQSGMVIKEVDTQNYLPLVTYYAANAFKQGDEVYYSIVARGGSEGGAVDIMIACYDDTRTFITGHGSEITLTTSNKTFTGTIKLSSADFNTASYYFIYINDKRATKSQIAIKQAKFLRKATADLIVDGAITTDKLDAGAVTTAKLDALAVTAEKIAAGTITSAKIGTREIKATNIDTDAVTADKIQAGAITTEKLDANAITAAMISGKTISSGVFKTNAGSTTTFDYDKTNGGVSNRSSVANNASLIMRPSGFQSLAASDDSILAQLKPALMNDKTTLGSTTVGWYLTPMAYIRRLFMDSGEAASKVDVNTAIASTVANITKVATPSTGVTGVSGAVSAAGIVTVRFTGLSVPANTAANTTIATLAADYHPAVQMNLLSVNNNFQFIITTGGAIRPASAVTAATPLRGSFTYVGGVVGLPVTIDYAQT